jgi:hypothetical protein
MTRFAATKFIPTPPALGEMRNSLEWSEWRAVKKLLLVGLLIAGNQTYFVVFRDRSVSFILTCEKFLDKIQSIKKLAKNQDFLPAHLAPAKNIDK